MIKDQKKFCEELRDFMKSQGLTQQTIAERLGVSQSYVGMLMSGNKAFGKQAAQTWAEAFGLSAAWLLTGEEPCLTHEIKPLTLCEWGANIIQFCKICKKLPFSFLLYSLLDYIIIYIIYKNKL